MPLRPRVLLVGDDIRLLQTREMLLGTRFEVTSSARLSEAFGFVLKQQFDLIIIFPEAESWAEFAEFIARQNPAPKIIAVTAGEVPRWADCSVPSKDGAFELLKVCAEHFGIILKKRSVGYSNRSSNKKVVSISSGDTFHHNAK